MNDLDLPMSKATEIAVIALVLRNEDVLYSLSDLTGEHFGDNNTYSMFQAFHNIKKAQGRITPASVIDQLKVMGNKVITDVHIHNFNNSPAKEELLDHYKQTLEDKMIERRLYKAADSIKVTSRKDMPIDEKIIESTSYLTSLSTTLSNSTKSSKEVIKSAIDQLIFKMQNPNSNMSWGLEALDRLHKGLFPGYHVVAAPSGGGKTAFLLRVATSLADKKFNTLVISAEMDSVFLMYREIQRKFNISSSNLKAGDISDTQLNLIKTYEPSEHLWINDTPSMDVDKMVVMVELHKQKFGLDCLLIDYLQILTTEKFKDETQQQKYISGQIRTMQRRLKIPVIVLSQYNKESYNVIRPTRGNLYGSSFLINDAHSISHLHMPWLKSELMNNPTHPNYNVMEVHTDKSRDGVNGSVFVKWIPEKTDIIDLDEFYKYDTYQPFDEDEKPKRKGGF